MSFCKSFSILLAAGLCVMAAPAVQAQSVALAGMMGNKPLLVVNGGAPRAVAIGESWQGVKVLAAAGDHATVQREGRRFSLRVGEAPVNAGSLPASSSDGDGPNGRRIVLTQGSGGHFFGDGTINGKAMSFVVDTGATRVSLGRADAERLGVNYKAGAAARAHTANGIVNGWQVKLNTVRVGNVQLYDVDGLVVDGPMPTILLGNSFLNRFTITQNGDQMVLDKRF